MFCSLNGQRLEAPADEAGAAAWLSGRMPNTEPNKQHSRTETPGQAHRDPRRCVPSAVTALFWFRKDLRLVDNPAWDAAAAHSPIRPVFVIEPALWRPGEHRTRQIAAELAELDRSLAALGGRLTVVTGPAERAIPALAAGSDAVYWNNDWSPYSTKRDRLVQARLTIPIHRFNGTLVHPPGSMLTGDGAPYKVFTPFYRKWLEAPLPGPAGKPVAPGITADPVEGVPDGGGSPLHAPGESAAVDRLHGFLGHVDEYDAIRDRPDLDRTSRMSADLKYGTISSRLVVEEVGVATPGRQALVRQLAWRDFHAHSLAAQPHAISRQIRPEYAGIRWRDDPAGLEAWRRGRTGYPIVDAGMRQLQTEGWMHNRLRLITASFLVKDLLIDWRIGERHFRRLLVDGDVAQNVGNWQWVAGTGSDAAPYFRVFNPVLQGRKFDPDGAYVRRWIPELSGLSAALIHAPWERPDEAAARGVTIGVDYPPPVVVHPEARLRALAAYAAARLDAETT